uniref:Uncharacterized protein n=1 Tax=Anguilla anguilla TaxID=7936 RepID=A0A0E9UYD0_ANGAN
MNIYMQITAFPMNT